MLCPQKKLERKTSLISILGKVQLYRRSVYLPVSRLHRLDFLPPLFSRLGRTRQRCTEGRLRLLRGAGVLYCPLLSLFDAVVITQGPTPPDGRKSDKVVLSANSVRNSSIEHSSLGENRHTKEMGCILYSTCTFGESRAAPPPTQEIRIFWISILKPPPSPIFHVLYSCEHFYSYSSVHFLSPSGQGHQRGRLPPAPGGADGAVRQRIPWLQGTQR